MYNDSFKKELFMMYLSNAYLKGSGFCAGVADHFRKFGKTYAVGVVVIGACALAAYVNANVEDVFSARNSGGRMIDTIGESVMSRMEIRDPTPHLHFLQKMISR